MATEVGETTYCPLIIGTWQWDEEIGTAGGWSFELDHELLLVGPHDAATAMVLPRGSQLKYVSEQSKPTVITAMYWQPAPGYDVVEDMTLGVKELEIVRIQAELLHAQVADKLPF